MFFWGNLSLRGDRDPDAPNGARPLARKLLTGSVDNALTPLGLAACEVAADGTLVCVNEPAAALLGYVSPDAVSCAIQNFAHQVYADPNTFAAQCEAILETGSLAATLTELRGADGGPIWVILSATASSDRWDGEARLMLSLNDVTPLIVQQRALQNSESSYRSTVENAAIGIYRSSADGRPLMANRAFLDLLGYLDEAEWFAETKDLNIQWYADPGRRAEFQALMNEHGSVTNFESRVQRPKLGDVFWISETARAVTDHRGDVLFYEGTVEDITERKEVEARLNKALVAAQSASDAKSEFLAHMSHELRTPLNAIIGFSEVMSNRMLGDLSERYVDYASNIYDSAELLKQLVSDVLEIAKADADRLVVEQSPVDLRALISSSVRLLTGAANERDVTIKTHVPLRLPEVIGDQRRLRQVILNVLSNAVKFTEPGTRVEVFVQVRSNGPLTVLVRDSGPGIPLAELERVFQPFVQLGEAGLAKDGTGLGLPVSRRLMRLHEGDLVLESTLDVGTTAVISLPPHRVVRAARIAQNPVADIPIHG